MTDKLTNNNIGDNTISGAKLSDATIPLGKLASGVVQLQTAAPGTAQMGNLSISGTGSFGSVSGNGSGLTSVPAAALSGIVADANLPASLARLGANQSFTGMSTFAGLALPASASAPSCTAAGQIYFNTTSGTLQVCDGTNWRLSSTQRAWTTLNANFALPAATTFAVVTSLNTPATKATATSTVKLTFTGNVTFPSAASAAFAQVQFLVDGTAQGPIWTYSDAGSGTAYLSRPFHCTAILPGLTSGSHLYGIQVQTAGGAGDAVAAGAMLLVEEDH